MDSSSILLRNNRPLMAKCETLFVVKTWYTSNSGKTRILPFRRTYPKNKYIRSGNKPVFASDPTLHEHIRRHNSATSAIRGFHL
jgi:hypothetical protein